jgi:CYTH domain-containing protein
MLGSFNSGNTSMALEIERKFLVRSDAWRDAQGVHFSQGYLNRDKNRTVRVRVAGPVGYLTIKGVTAGYTRSEFEYEIPVDEAKQLLALCEETVIEKIRLAIPYRGFVWEVDEFLGANLGLVVAEIELESADQAFERPDWVGDEVTEDPRYFNSRLSTHPYSLWDTGKQV